MSNEIRCNVDDLAPTIMKLLNEYGDDATKATNLAVEDEAKDIRKKVRQNVSSSGINAKKYTGGWQIKKTIGAKGVNCVIYNGTEPGLVHLLEKGHRIVAWKKDTGKSTRKFPHVEPATEHMDKELEDKIQKNLDLLS